MTIPVWMWLLSVGLFAATMITTTLTHGLLYAFSILFILLGHELGHYFTCRRYKVDATLPMFIPMPNLLGTMGAIISMKGQIPSRKALFDIGISGPLIGFVLAIPAVVLGIYLSHIQPKPPDGIYYLFGEPLLFKWVSYWLKGPIPEDQDLFLHPIAFAGWAALFVTSINLFPVGQLDGGHIIHALSGHKHGRWISWLSVAVLVYLGIQYHPMWFFFAAIILFFTFKSPPVTNDQEPLPTSRWFLGLLALAIMVLCFTPVPFEAKI